MQTEADIRKVLAASRDGEFGSDESMEAVRDLLHWVLGEEGMVPGNAPVDQFITEFITEPYR